MASNYSKLGLAGVSLLGCIAVLFVWHLPITEASGTKPRPCDPNKEDYPASQLPPKWRPGNFAKCLGGTSDAPGSGYCQSVWCGNGSLRIDPDPIETSVGSEVKVRVYLEGAFETGGNATTPNGGAELDWGDGTTVSLAMKFPFETTVSHKYKKSGEYFPSARISQDFNYQGKGSCSYRCDLRRAAVAVVKPEPKPPYLHHVQKGDTLSKIASAYGSRDWPGIYVANRKAFESPDIIYPGQTILVTEPRFSPIEYVQGKLGSFLGPFRNKGQALERPDIPSISGESTLRGGLHEGISSFFEWSIDKQSEYQANSKLRGLEPTIEGMLRGGSRGVVVRVGIYSSGAGKIPEVEIYGEGETPIIAVGDGLNKSSISSINTGFYFREESHLVMYSLIGGEVVREDLPNGFLTSGDAESIREMAAKEQVALNRGREIARQFNRAMLTDRLIRELTDIAQQAKASASARQSRDEGPRSPQPKTGGQSQPSAKPKGADNKPGESNKPNPEGLPPRQDKDVGKGSEQNKHDGLPDPGTGVIVHDSDGPREGQHPAPGKGIPINPGLMFVRDWAARKEAAFDWGDPRTRIWIDLNGDNFKDFCRVVGSRNNKTMKCALATGPDIDQQYVGPSIEVKLTDPGITIGSWTDVTGDGSPDFCRSIPTKQGKGNLSCFPVIDRGFGNEIRTPSPLELGLSAGRAWVDFDGDGRADFCTLVEKRPGRGQLSCILSTGNGFASTAIMSKQMNWSAPSLRGWISNLSGKASFCTVAGSRHEFVDCTVSTGKEFGTTVRDLLASRH